MISSVRNLYAVFAGVWPRIAFFADTPSLLAIALVANLVALIPPAFRSQKECTARTPFLEETTSRLPSD